MITYTELKAGLEVVNKGKLLPIHHSALGSGGILRVGEDIVVGMGSLFVYCDDMRVRSEVLEFMKNGEVVTSVHLDTVTIDECERL